MKELTDAVLVQGLKDAVAIERDSTASVVRHLAEFDRRRLYEGAGYPSLFAYCTGELGYSEDEACKRIAAARAAGRVPEVIERLEKGELHLAAVVALAPHLDARGGPALLAQAAGKSKRDVEFLAASLAPRADRLDCVRVEAVSGERVRIHFTADRAILDKLERLKGLLRHKYPHGRLECVIGEALDALLEKKEPSREPKFRRAPRPSAPFSRRVPRHVRRTVWKRDGGRCTFVGSDGRRCPATGWLEFDHIVPHAAGGRSDTAGNIRVLCRTHNQYRARRAFGSRIRPGADAAETAGSS